MPRAASDSDAWKRLVLRSMAPPAWLDQEGPYRDVVLSTRVRFMRNLRGHRFPHWAAADELRAISQKILPLANSLRYEILKTASPAERDFLVACRLASPDFDWKAPGRAVALDGTRTISLMVNEEDHIRLQALTPGWSLSVALKHAESVLSHLGKSLEFARNERFGYLAASAPNCGAGLRHSAMFHLIGLAHARRLGTVIKALTSQGLVVRGLFGERSRAIGAFVQVSTTADSIPQFVGACEYLIDEEFLARRGVPDEQVRQKVVETADFITAAKGVDLADALRILAWRRWGLTAKSGGPSAWEIDAKIPELALLESLGEPRAGRARVDMLRQALEL